MVCLCVERYQQLVEVIDACTPVTQAGANTIPRRNAESLLLHSAILASAGWEGIVHCEMSLITAYRCRSSTTHCKYATGALGMYDDNVASDPKTSKLHSRALEAF